MNTQSPQAPKKHAASFSPPDLLKVNQKDPNFRYRWIRPTDRMNFFNGLDIRGWEVVRWGSKGVENNEELNGMITQFSGKALGSLIRTGDLILARMPKAKAEERNAYYVEKARKQVAQIKDIKRKVSAENKDSFLGQTEEWSELKL